MSCWSRWPLTVIALVVWSFAASVSVASADEEEEPKAAAAEDAADEEAAEDDAAKEEADPLAVPEGGAKEMTAFIVKLARMRPEGETDLENASSLGKISRAMADAADQGLAGDPTDREAQMLTSYKFMALGRLQAAVKQEIELASAAAREDERPGVAAAGWQMFVRDAATAWKDKSDDEKEAFRDALLDDFPNDAEKAAGRANAIRMAGMFLERTDADFAKQLVKDAIAEMEASDDEKIAEVAEQLAGMLRKMDLMGNTMELHGPLLDGEEVDWQSYRGKVVLVDFWATWCGPCVAELPNVKEMYEGYHDKGFDVLGISLDTSKEKVEQFLEDKEIGWKTMFAADEEDQGWNHPMARHYGISGIPTAILVDRDGRVVHMNARGPALKEKLAEMLGEPAEAKEEAAEEEAGDGEAEEAEAGADEAAGQ